MLLQARVSEVGCMSIIYMCNGANGASHKSSRLSLNGLRPHFASTFLNDKARAAATPTKTTTATTAQQQSTNEASAFAPHTAGTYSRSA